MTTMFDMGFPEYLQSELETDPGLKIMSEIKSYDTFLDEMLLTLTKDTRVLIIFFTE